MSDTDTDACQTPDTARDWVSMLHRYCYEQKLIMLGSRPAPPEIRRGRRRAEKSRTEKSREESNLLISFMPHAVIT